MKKIALIVCALFLTMTEMKAQVFIGDGSENIAPKNTRVDTPAPSEQVATDSKKKYESIVDLTFEFNSDADVYGFSMGDDHYNFGMAFGDIFSMTFGYGFGKSYVFEDAFLIKGRLYPYLGFSDYNEEIDFLWGAAANLDIGIRLWKTEKGNSGFVTLGYNIAAPEFKTSGMVENGNWVVGISVVYW